jgi:hypothetical protein
MQPLFRISPEDSVKKPRNRGKDAENARRFGGCRAGYDMMLKVNGIFLIAGSEADRRTGSARGFAVNFREIATVRCRNTWPEGLQSASLLSTKTKQASEPRCDIWQVFGFC